jgi:MoxR-like ATPase
MGYPGAADEATIAGRYDAAAEPLDALRPVIDHQRMAGVIDEVRAVTVSEDVEAYLVSLVRATRDNPAISLGASPRASVALHRASQAAAWLSGRAFVLPDDVREVYVPVVAHRLVLDVDRQLRGEQSDGILAQVMAATPVPPIGQA